MRTAKQKVIANKEVILKEAELLFVKKGFRASSIRDLAHATGLSHGAIYHHFKNKEDIFLKLIEEKLKELTPAIKKAADSKGSVKERLIKISVIYLSWEPEKRGMIEQGFEDISKIEDVEVQEKTQRWANEYKSITQDLLEEGVRNGEIKNISSDLLHSILVGLSKGAMTNPKTNVLSPAELSHFIINLFFDGVKVPKNKQNG